MAGQLLFLLAQISGRNSQPQCSAFLEGGQEPSELSASERSVLQYRPWHKQVERHPVQSDLAWQLIGFTLAFSISLVRGTRTRKLRSLPTGADGCSGVAESLAHRSKPVRYVTFPITLPFNSSLLSVSTSRCIADIQLSRPRWLGCVAWHESVGADTKEQEKENKDDPADVVLTRSAGAAGSCQPSRALLQQVAEGQRRHILLPQALFASLALPVIWVAIPHNTRPWLYHSRWLVFTLALLINYEQAARASSTNVAWAVVSGLMSTYGTMLCFQHMILTNPQRDAARIIRVPCSKDPKTTCMNDGRNKAPSRIPVELERAARCEPAATQPPFRARRDAGSLTQMRTASRSEIDANSCYIWQRFPSDAPLLDRLGWATDLVLSLRGAGWSSSISILPKPEKPTPIEDGHPVCIASVPSVTKYGFEYVHPPAAFLRHRLKVVTAACLMLDFLGTFMMKDPYFVFGRDRSVDYALPWYLDGLSAWRLEAYRQLFSISGAFAAVAAAYSLTDLVHYYATRYCNPSRNIPWMYASAFGSFGEVFDRGLAGFWGSWWHQTFRQQFLSPAAFLLKKGVIRKGSTAGNLVALLSCFAMSGLLHGMGSLSAVPHTKLWKQPVFFLLQGMGIIVQQQLSLLATGILPAASVPLRRAGNALFTLLWLYATAALFNDDMADMGLWLLEPVPFSVFRALGLGFPGDAVWRWDSSYLFRWHSGRYWWQSGITI
ncbi:hypothetical protein LLEC1_03680 [Akanthomyces lecanii]|uniref:Wax synthase domain-containing protein n=1 Tax=Cordyceps confragosa TaxID=2714763 RepID=A0A179I3T4_CORDF|nr:hypothetical protein LLEC1_03680 [Akanthomyces lecanii]